MTKQELIRGIAKKANIKNNQAKDAVDAFIDLVSEELSNKG